MKEKSVSEVVISAFFVPGSGGVLLGTLSESNVDI